MGDSVYMLMRLYKKIFMIKLFISMSMLGTVACIAFSLFAPEGTLDNSKIDGIIAPILNKLGLTEIKSIKDLFNLTNRADFSEMLNNFSKTISSKIADIIPDNILQHDTKK